MKTLRTFGAVLAVALMAQFAAACSSADIEKFFFASGKIAYDSLRLSNQPLQK
jgi:hypothetical protein